MATYFFATTPRAVATTPIATVGVLVAARDIQPRTALSEADLKIVELPQESVPASALRDKSAVVGMVTTVPLAANEPVLPSKVATPGGEGRIAVLPPGTQVTGSTPRYRAVSLNVPDANAAGGAIVVGDHIDVLFTLNTSLVDPTKQDFLARVVVENVTVLNKTLTVYTLRIDVDTAERLATLQAAGGNLELLLRGPGDDRPSGSSGASFIREAQRIQRP